MSENNYLTAQKLKKAFLLEDEREELNQKETESLPKRLRPKQISEMFGVSLPTVWRYVRQGKLTRIKPSEKITLFNTQEVLKLFSPEVA